MSGDQKWIQVPVPEHLVDEVQVLLLNAALRDTAHAWDHPAMTAHLDDLDPTTRRMVGTVAETTIAAGSLTASAIAERLGVHVHEVYGMLHLANEVQIINRPDLLWIVTSPEWTPPGDRVVAMSEHLAELVVAVERGSAPEPAIPHSLTD